MGKQYLGLPSFQKTIIINNILGNLGKSINFHSGEIRKSIQRFEPNATYNIRKKAVMLSLVPEEAREELAALINTFEETISKGGLAKYYLTRIFTLAKDMQTIKECIPDCYWKHLRAIELTGEKDSSELFTQNYYDILEQVTINNILLGIPD